MLAALFAAAANRATGLERKAQAPQLPLAFVESAGSFTALTGGLTVEFTRGRVTFPAGIRMKLAGSVPRQPSGVDRLDTRVNVISGRNPRKWRVGGSAYSGIAYRGIYPGIDLTYGSSGRKLKSEFVVAPRGDPAVIRMRYPSAKSISIEPDGSLVVKTGSGVLREERPVLYQVSRSRRLEVSGRFEVIGSDQVGFAIGSYDRAETLYIDPVLSFSSYFGGSRSDAITGIAVGSQGDLYVTGWTESLNLPPSASYPHMGSIDAFVARFDASGLVLRWVTYYGGSGEDRALGIAVDGTGSPWITGFTTSRNLPLMLPFQTQRRGSRDAFVAQFDSMGSALRFSTYLGGSQLESGNAIGIEPGGTVVVGGETTSSNFPASPGPYQRYYAGQRDGFVLRLSTLGIISGTFLGGSGDDRVNSIAIAGGAIIAGGCTASANFPVRAASQPSLAGGQDGFVVSLNPSAPLANFATYLGGSGGSATSPECVNGVAGDTAGNVYATGSTPSPNFPAVGAFQAAHAGGLDAFVTKFTAGGQLVYSGYLGGVGPDVGLAIAVDGAQRPWIAGYTGSADFPVTAGTIQAASGGVHDAFVTRVESSGAVLSFSSYFGGGGSDSAAAIRCDAAGNAIAGGTTTSTDFPSVNALADRSGGGIDGFLIKVSGQ